jgi:hypothetical protein
VAFAALSANAATLSLTGGTEDVPLPANWDDLISGIPDPGSFVTTFNSDQATNGEGIYVSGATSLLYEYLGTSAGNTNTGSSGADMLFTTAGSSIGDVVVVDSPLDGKLDFSFWTDSLYGVGLAGSFANAMGTTLNTLAMAVFVESDTSMILMFDDGSTDQDYDDMLIRVSSISAIPLPAAAWLFGSGLLGLFGLRRRAGEA